MKEYELPKIHNDELFSQVGVTGDMIGQGISRKAYALTERPDLCIKVSTDRPQRHNSPIAYQTVAELICQEHELLPHDYLAKILAWRINWDGYKLVTCVIQERMWCEAIALSVEDVRRYGQLRKMLNDVDYSRGLECWSLRNAGYDNEGIIKAFDYSFGISYHAGIRYESICDRHDSINVLFSERGECSRYEL